MTSQPLIRRHREFHPNPYQDRSSNSGSGGDDDGREKAGAVALCRIGSKKRHWPVLPVGPNPGVENASGRTVETVSLAASDGHRTVRAVGPDTTSTKKLLATSRPR